MWNEHECKGHNRLTDTQRVASTPPPRPYSCPTPSPSSPDGFHYPKWPGLSRRFQALADGVARASLGDGGGEGAEGAEVD